MATDAVKVYLRQIEKEVCAGDATEYTHRPALKCLIEALAPGVTATHEPRRIACGAPDFEVKRRSDHGLLTIGHVETKGVDADLGGIEADSNRKAPRTRDGEQVARYRKALPNLILTNYLGLRWYVGGEHRLTAVLAKMAAEGKIEPVPGGGEQLVKLLGMFAAQPPEEIADPKELALRMANLTHLIRDIIVEAFKGGNESATLRDLHEAFEKTLIPALEIPAFADMFAQTLAYGLFAARCSDPSLRRGEFTRDKAAHLIPKTNPFLRRLFGIIAGPEMDDEPYEGHVNDLAQLLGYAQMAKVLENFGKRERKQDPVLHFYESFLAAYDPAERKKRGVFYTPEPVVSYIVRSVDYLLKTRFNCPDGLADTSTIEREEADERGNKVNQKFPRVLILDPACGTGTFLYAIVDLIREKFMRERRAGEWSGYVREHLLPRLFGFELLMAPYAVAHFKLGMQLAGQDLPSEELRDQWAYDFQGDERLGIYLTNCLEQAARKAEELVLGSFILEEGRHALKIKKDVPIMVVLGNPPYAGHSANRSRDQAGRLTFIGTLIEDYKKECPDLYRPAQAKWLHDDYVKFIRFGQWRIERTGAGVLALITNHGYLDNPTFHGMRQQLMKTFDEIYVLDLHGSAKKKEVCPDGSKDENVFDIRQGVAISILVKLPREGGGAAVGRNPEGASAAIHHSELWGRREAFRRKAKARTLVGGKYYWLWNNEIATTKWTKLHPCAPLYLFKAEDVRVRSEYEQGCRLSEIMAISGDPAPGVVTTHDGFAISYSREEAVTKVEALLGTSSEGEARALFRLCSQGQWNYETAKGRLKGGGWRRHVLPILYRPFDARYTVYDSNVAVHRRERVMRHMLQGDNIGLIATRSVEIARGWEHVLCTSQIIQHHTLSLKEVNYLLPLYLYPREIPEPRPWPQGKGGRVPNLSQRFVAELEEKLGLVFTTESHADSTGSFGPEDVFHYIYAVFHSPTYRKRYAEFLKRDFPRVPLTTDVSLFRKLCEKGADLVALHLVEGDYEAASWNRSEPRETSPFQRLITRYPVRGDDVVEKVFYVAPGEAQAGTGKPLPPSRGRVYISRDRPKARKDGQYFEGVPPEIWEFHIGGYQVCEKWLKDRKERKLSYEDIQHYHRIVVALNETIRLMAEIDEAIPRWPIE